GVYPAAGVAVVALTVLLLIATPGGMVRTLFQPRRLAIPDPEWARHAVSLFSLACLLSLIWIGLDGPRDPLSNLAPLTFWTLFWIGAVALAGLLGDIWRWLNPWTGLYALLGIRPSLNLPERVGHWPALALLIAFWAFLLADVAPDDPARVAQGLGLYWLLVLVGMSLFGSAFLERCEAFTVLFRLYGALSPIRIGADGGIGAPGWRILAAPASLSLGFFALASLGAGSFDGLNETFWWLAQIGVNPLEFPGRSAVVAPTLTGLALAIALLVLVFSAIVWIGFLLVSASSDAPSAIPRLALSVLPIAFGYHVAHYLTAFLVNGQYVVAALSDPWASGADFLGIQPFYVTTGFFNQLGSVRAIWLTQAGAVVIGHVWAVLLAHRIALDFFPTGRRAALATAPLSLFMIAYTFLGLWLLAAPRGA
ncbi:MAG: hypothetical protein AAF401_11820, partial [Pseudomonadota bacterium]